MQQGKSHVNPRFVIQLTDDTYPLLLEVDLKDDTFFLRTYASEPVEVDQFRSVFISNKFVSVPICRSDEDRSYLPMTLDAFKRLLGQVPVSYFLSFVYEPELKDLRDIISFDQFRKAS
jgi:hypothetical protein